MFTQSEIYRGKCTHYRKSNVIHLINGDVHDTCKSINAAKRVVRKEALRSYTVPTPGQPKDVHACARWVRKNDQQ